MRFNSLEQVYALEIQMYTAQKNNKKLKALYDQSLHIKSAIPHPLILGVIRLMSNICVQMYIYLHIVQSTIYAGNAEERCICERASSRKLTQTSLRFVAFLTIKFMVFRFEHSCVMWHDALPCTLKLIFPSFTFSGF